MLTLKQIIEQYPKTLQPFKRGLLREYLQYKILELLVASEHAGKLSFLGGTALRIIYGNTRFSEDLDFDNFGLSEAEFDLLAGSIQVGLEAQGLRAEMDTVTKNAYRCRIRLPEILFQNEPSANLEEKILIQIDFIAHGVPYHPERKILNKFDVFTEVSVTPVDILLSQKVFASLNRKRAKGRDFFDIVFLLSFAKPNYEYLKLKIGVDTAEELRARMIETSRELDFRELARDVQPFLFNSSDAKRVEKYPEYITQVKL